MCRIWKIAIILMCFINMNLLFSQSFPKPKDLSTGQGIIGNKDPNWKVSDWFPLDQPIPDPMTVSFVPATINVNCAPGAWVDPSSLSAPINNGNWITSDESSSCQTNVNFGYRFYRLTLNLPALCNGLSLNGSYKLYFTGYVDNEIKDVYVNGVAKGVHGGSYSAGGKIDFELDGPWNVGLNYIDVLLWNYDIGGAVNPYGMLLVADFAKASTSDLDKDGVPDISDDCPCQAGELPNGCAGPDNDGDGIADAFDIDDDNDGIPDNTEKYPNCEGSNVYNWVNWANISDKTATGEITSNGKTINVTVTQSNGGMLQTSGVFSGGIFPTNLNIPVNNSCIANSKAGTFTVTFSEPVSNPLFAFASVGNPGTTVSVVTSQPFNIVWAGQGVNYASTTEFIGQEGYNLIQIPQVGTTFTFEYQTSEYYCNIVFGAKDIVNCSGQIADTDGDGTPNYLDLDSDGDGCSDAFESGATTIKTPDFAFPGPYGSNGFQDNLEGVVDGGAINYISTYNQIALNKLEGKCVIIDTDHDGIEDEDDIDDDNDGVLDTDEGICTNNYTGFVPTMFTVFKYDLGNSYYQTATKDLPSNKLAISGVYYPPVPGKIDWRLSDASMHIGLNIPANQYLYKNGYSKEPNVNITIFRVIVPKGFKNVSQSITRFGVDGGTNIWKNGVMIDGMCCGDEGGPKAPITTTYTVNSGDTIEFRSVNGLPVHQSTNFEFTKIIGKCLVPDDFDTDKDGIVNRLDTDSDGDGCSDAFESGATLTKTPSNFTFPGPYGANGYKDSLETALESGTINYTLTYQKAVDSTYAFCDCPFGPEGMFNKDTLSFCGSAQIDAGTGFSYQWKDGSTDQILITNQTGKTFVKVGKPGCHYTDSLFVHVLSSGFKTRDTSLCLGNSIDIKLDLSSLNNYPSLIPSISWNNINQASQLSVKPYIDTLITCTLKNKLLTCKDSVMLHVVVGKTKINQLTLPICATDSILLKADTAKSYKWSNAMTTASIKVPSTVKVLYLDVVDTVGCSASDTLKLNYQLTPIQWNVTQVNVSCFQAKDGVVDLNPSGGVKPYSYFWSDSTTNNLLRNLDKGVVSVEITDANGCKIDTTFLITEPQFPLTISGNKLDVKCENDSTGIIDISIQGGTAPYDFNWNSGQKSEDIAQLKSNIYSLIVSDANGCQLTYQDTIKTLYKLPNVLTSKDTTLCLGDSIQLIAQGAIIYKWSPNVSNLSFVKPQLGLNQYVVIGLDNNQCENSDTLMVLVHDLPEVNAGLDQDLCDGDLTFLEANGNASKYNWNKNIVDKQKFKPNIGNESYILTGIDDNKCINYDSININVFTYPRMNLLSEDTIACGPYKTTYSIKTVPDNLTKTVWYVNNIKVDSLVDTLSYTFDKIGCYSIAIDGFNNICKSTFTKNNAICIIDKPIANFKVDTTEVQIQSPVVQFTNLSNNADNYLWNFDDDSISTLRDIFHTFPHKVGDFVVKLIASKNYKNCIDSHVVIIHVRDDLILYCPNTFTPDGDDVNEKFTPIFTTELLLDSYTFSIFNRWGQLVFETHILNQGWDGTMNGKVLAPDIYTYVIWFKDSFNGKEHRINGHVNLLR